MNLLQASIGHSIAAHFKRQNRTLHRDGPVALVNEDQEALVADLIQVFKSRDMNFDNQSFRKIVFNAD